MSLRSPTRHSKRRFRKNPAHLRFAVAGVVEIECAAGHLHRFQADQAGRLKMENGNEVIKRSLTLP